MSSVRRDKVVVIDIEATCWAGKPPPGQESEIIEVGVCLFDLHTSQLSHKQGLFVSPEKSVVSEFCTKLTTITPQQAASGASFSAVCTLLERGYDARNRLWASWGDYDRRMFHQQCESRGVRYPFSDKHMNLKKLFANLYKGQRQGMKQALETLGLPLEGMHHRGVDDAWNLGRLLQTLLARHGASIIYPYW